MSVSIKKTGIVSVSGGTNMNLMPNSYIMPLGTNNPVTGTWRLAGSNNMTRSRVLIENGMYGFQNSGIQTTPSGGYVDASCYGINNFPMEANTDYILSMWARITGGTEGYAGYSIYASSYVDGSDTKTDRGYRVTPLTKEWQRVWIHFRTNATENRNIYIGITTGETEVTTQMCLIKLEKGSVLTPWIPFLTDDIAVADYSTTTLSGEIVSFNDGAYNVPLKSLKVLVTAQQDLHGYDKPWAGGGGKNKLPNENKNTTDFTIDDDGYYTQNNPSSASWAWSYSKRLAQATLPSGNYVLSFYAKVVSTSTSAEMRIYTSDGTELGRINCSNLETASISFALDTETTIGVVAKIYAGKWAFQVEQGSTATAWTPYENICPITGWSGANVTRTGKNLFDKNATPLQSGKYISGGSIGDSPSYTTNANYNVYKIAINPNTTYTFGVIKANAPCWVTLDIDNKITRITQTGGGTEGTTITFTSQSGDYWLLLSVAVQDTYKCDDILQLEVGTATTYTPYNGNTYTIAFGDTYYGCELDVTNGVLRVDKAIVDLGSLNWSAYEFSGVNIFYANVSDKKGGGTAIEVDGLCEIYSVIKTAITQYSIPDGSIMLGNSTTYVYVNDTRYTVASDYKTAVTGKYLVYELATPFTIQLSPQQIEQLLGDNNVFADCGDASECKYISHSSQVDANFIETHPLLTQVNNSYINSNNFIEI